MLVAERSVDMAEAQAVEGRDRKDIVGTTVVAVKLLALLYGF